MAAQENSSENPVPLFKELSLTDDQQPDVTEVESLCLNCYNDGMTKLLLTRIPHFKEVIISSFVCESCGYENREVKSAGRVQAKGHRLTLTVTSAKDLDRQVIKSEDATFSIPEMEFEQPSSKKGEISTVEGLLDNVRIGLEQDQARREEENPEVAKQVEAFLQKWNALKELKIPFTFIIDDPTGNSFIENPSAPTADPALKVKLYKRTPEQNEQLALNEPEGEAAIAEEDEAAADGDPGELNLDNEVMVFKDNCPGCNAPCDTNMKLTDIPYFKQVVIMATSCDACGLRENEVKSFSGIANKGKRIQLKITNPSDLNRDLLKSDTCGLQIPELEFELIPGTLGGKFTTVEGLLKTVRNQLSTNQFLIGDSSQDEDKKKMEVFCEKLDKITAGEMLDVNVIMDDPTGNSYLQNPHAPDDDPYMTISHYTRTAQQDEELGLLDMKTENYAEPS